MCKWVSVKERYPETEKVYVVKVKDWHNPFCEIYIGNNTWQAPFPSNDITHWLDELDLPE